MKPIPRLILMCGLLCFTAGCTKSSIQMPKGNVGEFVKKLETNISSGGIQVKRKEHQIKNPCCGVGYRLQVGDVARSTKCNEQQAAVFGVSSMDQYESEIVIEEKDQEISTIIFTASKKSANVKAAFLSLMRALDSKYDEAKWSQAYLDNIETVPFRKEGAKRVPASDGLAREFKGAVYDVDTDSDTIRVLLKRRDL